MMDFRGNTVLIEKGEISFLHFPKGDVLYTSKDKEMREVQLQKALSLGNLNHHKVKIHFQDIEGYKRVETTIWGITETMVILKKNVIIPISRINEIEFIY